MSPISSNGFEAPALVLHYRGDRADPVRGRRGPGRVSPLVRFIAKEGDWHLPDARDVGDIIAAVEELLGS